MVESTTRMKGVVHDVMPNVFLAFSQKLQQDSVLAPTRHGPRTRSYMGRPSSPWLSGSPRTVGFVSPKPQNRNHETWAARTICAYPDAIVAQFLSKRTSQKKTQTQNQQRHFPFRFSMSTEVPTVPEETEARAAADNTNRCLLLLCIGIGAALLTVAVVTASVCGTGNCRGLSRNTFREIETVSACNLARCYLVDVFTRDEEEIRGDFAFVSNQDFGERYSIRCDPEDDDVPYIDFFYDDEFHRASEAPYYMEGTDSEFGIEPVRELSRCGNKSLSLIHI